MKSFFSTVGVWKCCTCTHTPHLWKCITTTLLPLIWTLAWQSSAVKELFKVCAKPSKVTSASINLHQLYSSRAMWLKPSARHHKTTLTSCNLCFILHGLQGKISGSVVFATLASNLSSPLWNVVIKCCSESSSVSKTGLIFSNCYFEKENVTYQPSEPQAVSVVFFVPFAFTDYNCNVINIEALALHGNSTFLARSTLKKWFKPFLDV